MSSWFEPDYLKDFHCKAGSCRHTCCDGWEIQVGELEYFRLIGMDCSDELHHRLEIAFSIPEQPTAEAYRVIRPNWLGRCPMLSDEGLCLLQMECGADALPSICRFYPRSFRKEGDYQRAVCSGSCEAVIELLMRLDRLTFHQQEDHERPLISEPVDDEYPAICRHCLQAIQDRSMSMRERIACVTETVGCKAKVTPEIVEAMLPTLLELSPELKPYLHDTSECNDQDQPWEENLLANHMLFVDFPYTDRRIAKADSAIGLMVCYELMQMLKGNRGDALVDGLSALFHLTEHTAFYYNAKLLYERTAQH